jgi:hypothetical protein
MKIEFLATFQGSNVMQLDDDMSMKIKFTADAEQLAHTIKMVTLKKKLFRVTLEEEKP